MESKIWLIWLASGQGTYTSPASAFESEEWRLESVATYLDRVRRSNRIQVQRRQQMSGQEFLYHTSPGQRCLTVSNERPITYPSDIELREDPIRNDHLPLQSSESLVQPQVIPPFRSTAPPRQPDQHILPRAICGETGLTRRCSRTTCEHTRGSAHR